MTLPEAFEEKLSAIPLGESRGRYEGQAWTAVRRSDRGGRQEVLFAEELGGTGWISFNYYRLARSGPVLKPCEMPAERVIAFVLGYEPG